MFDAYCDAKRTTRDKLVFIYDYNVVTDDQTPYDLGMDDGDVIVATNAELW